MKKVFIIFLGLFYGINTQAQVKIAYCKFEQGCKFYQTQFSFKDIDSMLGYLGTFEKSKGTMVFFKNKQGQDIHYPDSKRSNMQLHEYFGGKGEPSVAKGGMAFEKAIQPKDGNWTAITEKPILKNCPSQLSNQTNGFANFKSGNKVFSKPFNPSDLLPPNAKWITLSENTYRATIFPEAQEAFKAFYTVNVLSPTKLSGVADLYVTIPNQKTCEMKINFTFSSN